MAAHRGLLLAVALALACSALPRTALGGQLWVDVCTQANTSKLPFCDMSLPIEARVADYNNRVPIEQKPQMMRNGAQGFADLAIPPYQWGSEGLHGPLQPCVCTPDQKSCRCPTSFPCPSALATAFNDTLYFDVGQADGREARAINNLRNHATQNVYGDGIDYWSPTVNMQRDPRWGRNQEVPGEDPIVTASYATHFVQGLQGIGEGGGGLDSGHVQIAACCKHFVANSLEHWYNFTRHDFNAIVSQGDLHNYYLPAFRACVMEGKALGIMCSYNAVNGVPSCSNDWLLKDTLRGSWRFDGYVTSDCGAVANECTPEPSGHGTYPNCSLAAGRSVAAGTDTDCGSVYPQHLLDAINSGEVSAADVNASFARLTKLQMQLGLFDADKATQPYFNLGIDDIDSPAHQTLALEAARQSIVLLKNAGGVLPLKAATSLAVVGPHYNATQLLLSNYHGSRCLDKGVPGPGSGKNFDCITSPLAAIAAANAGGSTVGALGCEVDSSLNQIQQAVAAASKADTIILAVGIDQSQEREGQDRYNTTLPGLQPQLVTAILKLNKPTVMVLFNGGAMSLGAFKGQVPAIIDAFYGGEMGGVALADVLFGHYNPSGKLAATMYPPDYVNQIPLNDMALAGPVGRTHMFYTGTPEFPFGFGLSYTSWALAWATETGAAPAVDVSVVSPVAIHPDDAVRSPVSLRVRVHNTGGRHGKQTLFAFWRPTSAQAAAGGMPGLRQKLLAYTGAPHVPAGGSADVELHFDAASSLAIADSQGLQIVRAGAHQLVVSDGVNEMPLTINVGVRTLP